MSDLRYPLIFCDVDDTLLRDDRTISDTDLREILRFTQCGGKFVLVTGRNFCAAKAIYTALNLKTPIIVNQGCVFLPHEERWLSRHSMDRRLLADLCRFLEESNVYFQLFSQNEIFVRQATQYSHNFIKNCGVSITETHTALSDFLTAAERDVEKLMIECAEAAIHDLFAQLQQRFGASLSVEQSKSWIIEVSDRTNTKGEAIKYVCEHFGVQKDACMAIGDSQNDLSMFYETDFSVAVANANERVRAAASAITKSNNENGVGLAIRQYAYP